ncbi:MAG TPA: universal stress protein [Chloroflexia bacterium]|nr:universal stress protein [Chloroflexia bacterium]
MYTKLAVPLDGSPLAEKALPYAIKMANNLNAELLLLKVSEVHGIRTDTIEQELIVIKSSEAYLELVRNTIINPDLKLHMAPEKVKTLALYGDPRRDIADMLPFEGVDMVVMTTHGRTGISRLVMGSVATSVLQHLKLPVMLIKPANLNHKESLEGLLNNSEYELPDPSRLRVVLTLDGSVEAETALKPSLDLVRKLRASLYLLRVVVPMAPLDYNELYAEYGYDYGTEIAKENKERHEEPYKYLEKIQNDISSSGVSCVKVIRTGNAVDEIINFANMVQASMLVMATHARGPLGQVLLGSTANEVVRRSNLPVVLVHTNEALTQPELAQVKSLQK